MQPIKPDLTCRGTFEQKMTCSCSFTTIKCISLNNYRLALIMKMPALPRIALACQLLYYSSEDGLGKRRY